MPTCNSCRPERVNRRGSVDDVSPGGTRCLSGLPIAMRPSSGFYPGFAQLAHYRDRCRSFDLGLTHQASGWLFRVASGRGGPGAGKCIARWWSSRDVVESMPSKSGCYDHWYDKVRQAPTNRAMAGSICGARGQAVEDAGRLPKDWLTPRPVARPAAALTGQVGAKRRSRLRSANGSDQQAEGSWTRAEQDRGAAEHGVPQRPGAYPG